MGTGEMEEMGAMGAMEQTQKKAATDPRGIYSCRLLVIRIILLIILLTLLLLLRTTPHRTLRPAVVVGEATAGGTRLIPAGVIVVVGAGAIAEEARLLGRWVDR